MREFLAKEALWIAIVGGALAAVIAAAIIGLAKWPFRRKKEAGRSVSAGDIKTGERSASQVVVGDGAKMEMKIDKSRHVDKGVNVTVEAGGTLNIIDYPDGVAQSEKVEVKTKFAEGRVDYEKGRWEDAIEKFMYCVELEEDCEKRGALNLQIGNCYYYMHRYMKAAEYYAAALRESRKGSDKDGEAANLNNMANTYVDRPASSGEARGENVRSAIECYKRALEIYKKDEYRVQYATTQNNLGTAYTDLPSASAEERASNVRQAIECYKRALEIRKKDEYPQSYSMTAANMGITLADTDKKQACHWLKEAYSLREYLVGRAGEVKEMMDGVCEEHQ